MASWGFGSGVEVTITPQAILTWRATNLGSTLHSLPNQMTRVIEFSSSTRCKFEAIS